MIELCSLWNVPLKGCSTQKWKFYGLLIYTKKDILENNWNQLFGTIDFHSIFFSTMEVNGAKQLVPIVLQNIFICVQQKKETHTGLQQLEGE